MPVEKGFEAFKFIKIIEASRQANGFEISSVKYPEDISKGFITIEIKQAFNSGEIKELYDYFKTAGMKHARRIANGSKDIIEAYMKAQQLIIEAGENNSAEAEEIEINQIMQKESKEAVLLSNMVKNIIIEKIVYEYQEQQKSYENNKLKKQLFKEERQK